MVTDESPKIFQDLNDQRSDQTAFFLAPIITDFIRNTKRELYDENRFSGNLFSARGNWAIDPENGRPNPD